MHRIFESVEHLNSSWKTKRKFVHYFSLFLQEITVSFVEAASEIETNTGAVKNEDCISIRGIRHQFEESGKFCGVIIVMTVLKGTTREIRHFPQV